MNPLNEAQIPPVKNRLDPRHETWRYAVFECVDASTCLLFDPDTEHALLYTDFNKPDTNLFLHGHAVRAILRAKAKAERDRSLASTHLFPQANPQPSS